VGDTEIWLLKSDFVTGHRARVRGKRGLKDGGTFAHEAREKDKGRLATNS